MASDGTVIGLTLVKINGIYELDVRNARWSVKRNNTQHATGGGVKQSIGLEMPSGSFDEVIPRSGATNWRALKSFSVEIYDSETRSVVVAAFRICNWTGIDGTADQGQATASKAIAWNGSEVVTA